MFAILSRGWASGLAELQDAWSVDDLADAFDMLLVEAEIADIQRQAQESNLPASIPRKGRDILIPRRGAASNRR